MTVQHVIVMQDGTKAMWKWRSMALKVSILRLRKQCPEEKGCRNVGGVGQTAYPFLLSKHRSSKRW